MCLRNLGCNFFLYVFSGTLEIFITLQGSSLKRFACGIYYTLRFGLLKSRRVFVGFIPLLIIIKDGGSKFSSVYGSLSFKDAAWKSACSAIFFELRKIKRRSSISFFNDANMLTADIASHRLLERSYFRRKIWPI